MQMQVWTWTETNWTLILMIIVGSGALAWLGDVIGMKFGKRRISFFKLRPKTASHVITALTGMGIAVLTVVILASFSDSVRTALFSLKYIQRQLTESRVNLLKSQEEAETSALLVAEQRSELEKSRSEVDLLEMSLNTLKNDKQLLENERNQMQESVAFLRNEADDLKRLLEQMREGTIVVRIHEVLAQNVIPPESASADITEIIERTRTRAAENIAERFGTLPENVVVTIERDSLNGVIASSINSDTRRYLRLSAEQNVASGAPVQLTAGAWDSYEIYEEGEPIYRRLADAGASGFNAEDFLHLFLRELRFKAIRDGISPDPVTNNIGSLDGQKFFETVEMLSEMKAPVIVNGIATKDTFTEGPVSLKIVIEE